MVLRMTTFVLVHGAWHGAWCWDRLVPELTARGAASVTMDLPVDDGNATFDDYSRAVLDAAAGIADDVVVVGHSLGSMVIPLVAAARPVAAMVFLCGVVPSFEGGPWDGAPPMQLPGTFDGLVTDRDGGASWPSLERATAAFYGDCAPDDAAWAFARLRPQNSTSLWSAPYALTAWPEGRRIAIVAEDDAAVTLEFSRYVCEARLGVEPIVLAGGHSPFLSRPAALADALVAAVG